MRRVDDLLLELAHEMPAGRPEEAVAVVGLARLDPFPRAIGQAWSV